MKILLTNSYFNVFNILLDQIPNTNDLSQKNYIFCEEKCSLMIERLIANKFCGSFNTSVYSFGNYMRIFRTGKTALTREGSCMAIKKIISTLPLSLLNKGKDIANSVYTQIAQLKSSNISPEDLKKASDKVKSILQIKLQDLEKIYSAYEQYLLEHNLEDQGTALKYFKDIVESQDDMASVNVFVVGYSGLTRQNLEGIGALIKKCKSFTAILPFGENKFSYVNETVSKITKLCKDLGITELEKEYIPSPFTSEGEFITKNIFFPKRDLADKISTDKIYSYSAVNPIDEAEKVATIIKSEVLNNNKRYRDFTVVIPSDYDKTVVSRAFNLLEVPVHLDTQYTAMHHPLITLIFDYTNIFIKNFEREAVLSLVKNPLFCEDKKICDEFCNYVYKYNVNYSIFKKPFLLNDGKNIDQIENLRQKLAKNLTSFNVSKFLIENDIENKLIEFAKKLNDTLYKEEGAVCEQIYQKVISILDEVKFVLGEQISYLDFKNIFYSGVMAMKLNIIPQYNDAVFVGDFKECAYGQAKNLFVMGLTTSVPAITEDTTLLSSSEVDLLSTLKEDSINVEPTIKIFNKRTREQVMLGVSSFSERLYISYAINSLSGTKNEKGQVFSFINNNFKCLPFPETDKYITKNQGVKNFSLAISKYKKGRLNSQNGDEYEDAINFYYALNNQEIKNILSSANSEIKQTLEGKKIVIGGHISPTTLERYYECPYRAFLTDIIGVKEREEGKVGGLEVGNIMHDIFYEYFCNVENVKDEKEFNELFENCVKKVLEDDKYKRYLQGEKEKVQFESILKESKKHCYNSYKFLKNSSLKPEKDSLEKSFSLTLKDGKTSLYGRIDRIDSDDKYFRIVDYKTGRKIEDVNQGLYYGTKLQLYLYSLAIKDKTLAGLYYYDVEDEFFKGDTKKGAYFKGKSLDLMEAVYRQDSQLQYSGSSEFVPVKQDGRVKKKVQLNGLSSEETIKACVDYALIMCENALDQMKKGSIIPSPIDGACAYCKFKSMCQIQEEHIREKSEIKDETLFDRIIKQSLEGGSENGDN